MCYHPRIESKKFSSLLTTRSRNSELWLVNNKKLEHSILGYAAKFSKRYDALLYALAIEGDHIHHTASFPELNRSSYMRDFNSCVARAVDRHTPEYPGGTFWARRYSAEFLPENEDIEDYFFYVVLQPVKDGLAERISDYPGYNCFHDAIHGIKRKFKVVSWAKFHAAKRYNPRVSIKDYTEEFELEYKRLPGYEHLSRKEYVKLMNSKLEEKRAKLVKERRAKGKGFAGRSALLATRRGSKPKSSKTSTRNTHRPRVLSRSKESKNTCLSWYFHNYQVFKKASKLYRDGKLNAEFPEGMYRPYVPVKPKPT